MNGVKTIFIAAELAAVVCLGIVLYHCGQEQTFDFEKAWIAGMFALSAVIFQAMQDEIQWNETKDEVDNNTDLHLF